MSPEDIRAAITFANGIDPRVQMTHPNAELWGHALSSKRADELRAAIIVYYERPHPSGRERPPVDPASIRKIIHDETERGTARSQAIEATKPVRTPGTYRARNPEAWDRLVKQGRDDYRADLKARGITPHAETCATCKPR